MDVTLGRTVTVFVTCGDVDLGQVGPFEVASPWWADVEPVVAHLRAALGVNVVVVRILDVHGGISPRNGHVTYHVEALRRPSGTGSQRVSGPWRASGFQQASDSPPPRTRSSTPGRAGWATPEGIRDALTWAETNLTRLAGPFDAGSTGTRPAGSVTSTVEQVKTWNLSGLFRIPSCSIPSCSDPVWLKLTPLFGVHEPDVTALIGAVDRSLVPTVLATDPEHRRTLLAHVPGEDCWDASPQLIRATLTRWVAAQAALARGPLTALPDRRPGLLVEGLERLLDGDAGSQLNATEMATARELLGTLPARIDRLEACGLPDTLVHGDFHPGNWRSDGVNTVLVDFADAFYGHPAFDGERLRDFLDDSRQDGSRQDDQRRSAAVDAWCDAWAEQVPGSDPKAALEIARPLQAISGAILYQLFLDNVEDSERRYHEGDPAAGIRAALGAVGRSIPSRE